MKIKKLGCALKTCSMCKGCKPEWLKAIDINRKILHYNKGEILFHEGDTVNGMYFIYSGLVKFIKSGAIIKN